MTIIDTDILIDAGRGVQEAVDCLNVIAASTIPTISVVTQMELIVGCRNKSESQKLAKFLERFEIAQLDETISTKAVDLLQQYRLSHGLLIADSLIAATAVAWEMPLISKNQRDYKFISELKLLPYP